MNVSARLVKYLSLSASTSPISTTTLLNLASNHPKGIAKVVLKKGKTQLFRDGSPMVYSGAVDRIIGKPPPKTGDVVLVADGTEKPIGWGLYNSVSMFCVRLMQLEEEATRDPSCALDMENLLEARINASIELRTLLGLPSAYTTAYRLVNSEGDRLSGLIVDIFGGLAVVASSAAWVEKYRQQVEDCISRIDGISHINWRPSVEILKEEGLDLPYTKEICLPRHSLERIKVVENGISYAISLEGQKTGFYVDQRENRQFISTISNGQSVLDLCCYSGGFSLNAARGGAVNVTGVDSSLPAIDLANENIVLNNMDPGRISFLRQDATTFMKEAVDRKESWDLVILDPPQISTYKKAQSTAKICRLDLSEELFSSVPTSTFSALCPNFQRSLEVLQSASGMYRNLNSLAMQLTKRGGLLMTCSCSGAMTQSGMFLRILQGAAALAGRKITIMRQAGAACDHPLDPSYPEGAYLSNILLRIL